MPKLPKPNCSYPQFRDTQKLYFQLVSDRDRCKRILVEVERMIDQKASFFTCVHFLLQDLDAYFQARIDAHPRAKK